MFLVCSFLACSEDSPTEPDLTMEEKLQKALDDGIIKYSGKGISAAVIFPSGEEWKGVSGVSHGNVPVTKDMLFSAGSITKTFTAAAILQMADEGKINLDDQLRRLAPGLGRVHPPATVGRTGGAGGYLRSAPGLFQ